MHDTINGAMFKEMLLFGTVSITQAQQAINDLNVFPVPDGDTGTNMSLTIQTAAQELKKIDPKTVDQAASVTASALLRGARGNSGVILSLLFRGVSKELKGCTEADGAAFAAALQEGVAAAYNAVMKPAEGTILTVSRLAAERAVNAAEEHNSVEYVIEQAIAQGEITLAQTTDMNPVLKKAGVVDAGGKGFLLILGGMLSALRGEERPELTEENAQEKADFAMLNEEDITFTFDTVFIVRKSGRSIEPFRRFLDGIGDSLVIGEDDEAFKVHVHTDIPGEALTEAQKYGTLELAKIENMRTQAQQLAETEMEQHTLLTTIPNLPCDMVPAGISAADNVVEKTGGPMPDLGDDALPHWDLCKKYNLIDFDLGVKITGAGFPVYIGKGARLQRALIQFFLDQANRELGKHIVGFDPAAAAALARYAWPGNLRQLKNTVRSATLLAAGDYITCRELPAEIVGAPASAAPSYALRDPVSEEEQIRRALAAAAGNKSQAAKLLGIDRKTLYNKLRLYGIE